VLSQTGLTKQIVIPGQMASKKQEN
jgi:hypothetical protein